jgi:hypothetical protein
MELAQDRVQWRTLVLEVLNLRVPLPELVNYFSDMMTGESDEQGF